MFLKKYLTAALAVAAASTSISNAEVVFFEDFDGGGVNSVFNFTTTSGAAPAVLDSTVAEQAMVAQITDLAGSTSTSIAFDAFALQSVQAQVRFDFRMSTDEENTTAGGCCGQAADGFGIGIFDSGIYGTTGAVNPAAGTANWEDPNTGEGFPGAVVISFDIFDSGDGLGNHIRVNGVGGPADSVGSFIAPFPLNDGIFHRAILTFDAAGDDTLLSVDLIRDINGAATEFSVVTSETLAGVDLAAVNARMIAGGRTGGAFVRTQLDNLSVETFQGDDSDFDGMPDFWEDQNGLDKNDPDDANVSADADTLTNLEEFMLGTDPQDADSDDDTLNDDIETGTGEWMSATDTGTSPLTADSDSDGLADNVETCTDTFQNATDTGSDPNVADSDGDSFDDGVEVSAGTDPTDPNDFPSVPILLAGLVGGDLTDPENDGDIDLDLNYNAVFESSEEPGFGGGEFAFNVFDNQVGGSNAKWCCGSEGGNFPAEPIWVQATFEEPIVLSSFTLTSGNDTPAREPRVWEIQGSNDGENFETIFAQDDINASVWTSINQTLQWNADVHFVTPPPYMTFRFSCSATGTSSGARYQLNEIELFGTPGNLTPFSITSIELNEDETVVTVTWNSRNNRVYAFDWSTDMTENSWNEEDDGIPSGGETTSFDFPVPAGSDDLFFRVRDVSP